MKKSILVVSLVLILSLAVSGCSGLGDEETEFGGVKGKVTFDGEAVPGVEVTVKSYDTEAVTTDENGLYSITNLPTGEYTLQFKKSVSSDFPKIDKTQTVVISGGKKITKDVKLTSEETSLDTAKNFVDDLKEHGVNLKTTGQTQAQKIEEEFKENIIPYTVAVGYRLKRVNEVLNVWSQLASVDDGNGPGDYTVNMDNLEAYEDMVYDSPSNHIEDYWDYEKDYESSYEDQYETYRQYYFAERSQYESWSDYVNEQTNFIVSKSVDSDLKSLDIWEWSIDFENSEEQVNLKITNPYEVYTEEEKSDPEYGEYTKHILDYSQAELHYDHTSATDSDFNWELNFNFAATNMETITSVDADNNEYELHLPKGGEAELMGTMTDSQTISDEDGRLQQLYEEGIYDSQEELPDELPAIGTINLDSSLTLDMSDAEQISYEGEFNSEVIDYEGSTTINFKEIPSYQDIYDGTAVPLLESISSSGEMTTNIFKISGSSEVEFVEKEITLTDDTTQLVSLADKIVYEGSYQDITEEQGFTLNGGVTIDPDYSNFQIDLGKDQIETETNYVQGQATLTGELKNISYQPVDLEVTVKRDGYEHITSKFEYNYAGDKYIAGTMKAGETEEFNLTAQNEQQLKIRIEPTAYSDENQIGTITDFAGEEAYADIIMEGSQPVVNYSDHEQVSLLP